MSAERDERVRRLGIALLCLAALILLGSFVRSRLMTAEERIQAVMRGVAEAAAGNDPRGISDQLSEGFKVAWRRGSVDKAEVHQAMVRLLMVDFKAGFEITYSPEEIHVDVAEDGRTATARFRVRARGKPTPTSEWVQLRQREASGKVIYKATFTETEDGWKLHRVEFER